MIAGVMQIILLSTMNGFFGGEVHLVNLAAGLTNRGHEVSCVVRPNSDLHARLDEEAITAVPLNITQWYQPGPLAKFRSFLKATQPDILHSHNPRDYFIAAAATWGLDVTNVGTRHQLRSMALPGLKRPFLRRFQGMIAVSDAVRSKLEANKLLPENCVVTIHNGTGVSASAPPSRPASGRLRLACGARENDPVVGMVGRLSPEKGIETAIRAVARLRRDWPRLKLCLVGDGNGSNRYRSSLKAMVQQLGLEKMVHFVGYQPGAQRAINQFDVLVVSSLAEPFGLVTIEAMALGCPVVVTDTGGSPEIVRDGVEGFLFSPGDDGMLAKRLEVLLESQGLNRQMGQGEYR